MSLWPRLGRDFRRLREGKKRSFLFALFDSVLLDNGFQVLLIYRMSHTLLEWRVPLLSAILRRTQNALCGADVAPRASIGGGCVFPHGLGLVFGSGTIVGEDCTILHGVTLGEARFDGTDCPRIGDRVTIGARACVLGAVSVGDDAVIGAGSVVLTDVPAGAVVAGVPARVVG